jgi:serine/threonine protein kinase
MSNETLIDIFNEAVEKHDPVERAAFLDLRCGVGTPLRQSLEKLLRAHENAGGFLAHPSSSNNRETGIDSHRTIEKIGDVIGCYKLVRKIGEGGCGIVYEAEQVRPVQRTVALKIVKLGMDTNQSAQIQRE